MESKTLPNPGPSLGFDYFLYTCFECEKLAQFSPKTLNDERRYLSTAEVSSSKDYLDAMLSHYVSQFPELIELSALSTAELNLANRLAVFINLDLRTQVKKLRQGEFPEYLSEPSAEQSPDPLWQELKQALDQYFPIVAPYLWHYLTWTHTLGKEEAIEPGSRPPVGRYSPTYRPHRSGPRPQGGRRPPPGQSNFGSRGPERGDRGGERADRPERGGSRPPRPNFGERPDRPQPGEGARSAHPRSNARFDQQRGRRPLERGQNNGPRKDRDEKLSEELLSQVHSGAQALDADPNLSEFTLPPANSFYRRLQHEEVKKIGYHSRSDGEGQQRSVVMLRYPPESGDET